MVPQPGDTIGPYRLQRFLGRGKSGIVWLAERCEGLASPLVALKMPYLPHVVAEAIQRESDIWVKASGHVNIVPVIEAAAYDGQLVIASEYVSDGSLEDWIASHQGVLPDSTAALTLCSGILSGVRHLHSMNIVHRDLKPANILIQKGTPRITDFGFSRVIDDTWSMVAAGSPAYMAPEVWRGERTMQADVWSVGVILFQLLEGTLPFPQDQPATLMYAILNESYLPPQRIGDRRLLEIISKSLSKDLSVRYASAQEMLDAVNRYLGIATGFAVVADTKNGTSATDTPQQLWQRICEFSFADISPNRPFEERLKDEMGWDSEMAASAINEYRRFLYLAVTSPHSVVPCDIVDAVWHLHLQYTKSYWADLCRHVLRKDLHHEPYRNSGEELFLEESYSSTMLSYRAMFGEPPAVVWGTTAKAIRAKKEEVRVEYRTIHTPRRSCKRPADCSCM